MVAVWLCVPESRFRNPGSSGVSTNTPSGRVMDAAREMPELSLEDALQLVRLHAEAWSGQVAGK